MKRTPLTTLTTLLALTILGGMLSGCADDGEASGADTELVDSSSESLSSGDADATDDDGGPRGDRPPHEPPAEAVDACEGLADGDACSFDGPDGETITGTCDAHDDLIACRPDQPPPHGNRPRHEPPAEAIEACDGAVDGDSCEFEGRNGETVSGICETHDDQIACAPDHPPCPPPDEE